MHTTKFIVAIAALSIGLASADKMKKVSNKKMLKNKKHGDNKVMDEEDVAFFTRLLQDTDRGKDTELGSLPVIERPPDRTPMPSRNPTRRPVANVTPKPISTPTPPAPPTTPTPPAPPTFNCPLASFVGCTAPDPANPEDECPTVGEPCESGNVGEFCCRDACPRNYCTAKEAI
eukprot:CAMPEP_0172303458 /NCGR_PEP_ID=MMETSP1058-20130122/4995_1 /TAXON_ID=83371 /ORGANISM="Detonula confervacea, Strain CCMP 353" /LENGTH=173 /DNA_ID=CAMNT_0013014279 /DNA_START=53 /DNA_END=574 /DNA_ORIENTATION=+